MIKIGTAVYVKTDDGEKVGTLVARGRNPMGYPILTVEFRSIDPANPTRREDFSERDVTEA